MSKPELSNVNNSNGKTKQLGLGNATSAIRIDAKSKKLMDDLLKRGNKTKVGRMLKPSDLICFSLELVTEDHLQELCNKSLRNRDRIEILFERISKEKRGISRDDFDGMLLNGEFAGRY